MRPFEWFFFFCCVCLLPVPDLLAAQDAPIPLPGDASVPAPGDAFAPFEDETAGSPAAAPFPFSWSNALEFRGYVENTTTIEYLKRTRKEILLNAGRARLNIEGRPDERWGFGVGLAGAINSGATEISLTEYLPDFLRQAIVPGAEECFQYRIKTEDLFLQEAFGAFSTGHVHIRVGRHKFYTGAGYAYNPIDLFNVKNPLDPTHETGGLDAFLLRLHLPRQTEFQGLIRFGERFENSDYLARLKTFQRGWDVALQYTHAMRSRIDWEALNSAKALEHFDRGGGFDAFRRDFRWNMIAVEFAGEFRGWGVYAEGGHALIDAPEQIGSLGRAAQNHERLLVGIDHTFGTQLAVMLEYLRLGQGRTNTAPITLNERLAYLTGELLSLNRDTLFTGLSHPLTDLLDFSLHAIIGCNDGSVLLNSWLLYDLRPGLKWSLSLNLPIGNERSQNGKTGASGFARLKCHF